ncbi:hypothetical protein BDZ89DRAFT_1065507 [Hymenopellis radicata]|nr:hypothetical protein BDZ89DRAFT_1065507 [Hymenopellis radicata]
MPSYSTAIRNFLNTPRGKQQDFASRARQNGSSAKTAEMLAKSASNNVGIDPNASIPVGAMRKPVGGIPGRPPATGSGSPSHLRWVPPVSTRNQTAPPASQASSAKTSWHGHTGHTNSSSSSDAQSTTLVDSGTPVKHRHSPHTTGKGKVLSPISEGSDGSSQATSVVSIVDWSEKPTNSPGYLTPDTEVGELHDHSSGNKAQKEVLADEASTSAIHAGTNVIPAATQSPTAGKQPPLATPNRVSTASAAAVQNTPQQDVRHDVHPPPVPVPAPTLAQAPPVPKPPDHAPPAAPKPVEVPTTLQPREAVQYITEASDVTCIPIILALLHDCYLFVDDLRRGVMPGSVFSQRYRYLSLHIVGRDTKPFEGVLDKQGLTVRYTALRELVVIRQRTLFATPLELKRMERTKGNEEIFNLRWIISVLFAEKVVGAGDNAEMARALPDLLRYIYLQLQTPSYGANVANRVRAFLKVPLRDDPRVAMRQSVSNSYLPIDHERALIYDVVLALLGMVWKGFETRNGFISLEAVHRQKSYSDSFSQRLVLARDVLCGLLPGPSPLTAESAFEAYVKPLINHNSRTDWCLYNVITPEERAYVNSGGLLGVKMYLEDVSKARKEWRTQQCVGFMMARLDLLVERCYPHL